MVALAGICFALGALLLLISAPFFIRGLRGWRVRPKPRTHRTPIVAICEGGWRQFQRVLAAAARPDEVRLAKAGPAEHAAEWPCVRLGADVDVFFGWDERARASLSGAGAMQLYSHSLRRTLRAVATPRAAPQAGVDPGVLLGRFDLVAALDPLARTANATSHLARWAQRSGADLSTPAVEIAFLPCADA